MNRAFIIVSFGTSYIDTRKKNIDSITEMFKNKYSGFDFFNAWTSHVITRKINNMPRPNEMIEKLINDGYKQIFIQPTLLLPGYEYSKITKAKAKYESDYVEICVGEPLLGPKESIGEVVNILKDEYSFEKNEPVVFMGHGSKHNSNEKYQLLNDYIISSGIDNGFVATVEGTPDFDDAIEWLKQKDTKKVRLVPLMFVAGDHIKNDMLGDEEGSWKSVLENKGYEVEGIEKGLGEIKQIQEMFMNYAKEKLEKEGWL